MGILRLVVSRRKSASLLPDSSATRSLLYALALLFITLCGSTADAATINVNAGGNLQAALNSAQPGDTIVLQAGASFTGPFTLPNKGASQEWITVRTSTPDSSLAASTGRVSPADASMMPKLLSAGFGAAALQTAPGAHHWRLIGLEIRPSNPAALIYDLVKLGDGSADQDTPEEVPHHLILDRCLVTAFPNQTLKRGISLQSAETTITGCYVAGFKSAEQDAQAVAGWNGPGPFHVVNNYLEASGENLVFGGAPPSVPGLVPSDIEVRRNHFFKPLSWRQGEPGYAGTRWSVKNLFELKSARRVVFEGNLLENCWNDVNWGYGAINLTVRGDSGPQATLEDITIANNVVKHVGFGINVLGRDTSQPSQRGRGLKIVNNLFVDVNGQRWSEDGLFLKISDMPDVVVDHNTVLHTGNDVFVYGPACEGFVFTNNVMSHNSYGIMGADQQPGKGTFQRYFPGVVMRRNVIAGSPASDGYPYFYPSDNFYPSALAQAAFNNPVGEDYALSAASPFRNKGTDGKDVGCDFVALAAALAGTPANPPPPPPPPTPTPTPVPTATPTPTPVTTPTATPTPTPAATPTPVPTPTGKAQSSLHKARQDAQIISNDLATTPDASQSGTSPSTVSPADRIAAVVSDVQQTFIDFSNERAAYPAALRIETALSSALTFAASAGNFAGQGQLAEAKSGLQKAIDNMELADVLMSFGDVQNPLDFTSYFVRQHYVDFLGREPDEAGRAFWQSQIASCGTDARCVEVKRINVSAAYFLSIEFKETGFLIYRLYRASFGRTLLMREFLGDTQEVGKGVIVGEPSWQEKLAANKSAFFKAWVQRSDFRSRYDSMTHAQFVDSLYASMGVVAPQTERDSLVSSLQTGASTRADVLARLVDNSDFSRLEKNRAFVLMQYFGYMRRDPDQIGWDFWLKKLDDNNGDFVKAQMVKAFLDSTEYRNRFRQQ